MRKIIIILIFIISINIFSNEFIFRDYKYYDDIDYLYRKGFISINIQNLPILKSQLKKELLYVLNSNRIINSTDKEKILELYFDIFDNKSIDLSDDFFVSANVYDSLHYSFENKVQLSFDNKFYSVLCEGQTNYPYVQSSRTKEWNNSSTIISKGYFGLYKNKNYILFGRFLPAWGQGLFDNMFISRYNYSYDGLMFNIHKGFFDFSFFTTMLSPHLIADRYDSGYVYMSMHKVSAILPLKSNIAFKELIIYNSILPETYYINPFIIYYMTQWNLGGNDNIIWSLQYNTYLLKIFQLNFEFFIDDYQYDKDNFNGPNKLAYLINTSHSFGNLFLALEYVRILKWTGTHQYDNLKYVYYDMPIMYNIGPDADQFGLQIKYYYNDWNFVYNFTYTRHGEGTINLPYETERGTMFPEFPSGNVTKTYTNKFIVKYKINKYFNIQSENEIISESGNNKINIELKGVFLL